MSFVSRRFLCVEKSRPLTTTSGRVSIRRGLKLRGISDRRVNAARPSSKWIVLASPIASKTTDHSVEDACATKTKDQRLVSTLVATGLAWLLSGSFSLAMSAQFEEYSKIIEERTGQRAVPEVKLPSKEKDTSIVQDTSTRLALNEAKIKELERQLESAKTTGPAPYFAPSAPVGSPPTRSLPALEPTPVSEDVEVKTQEESSGGFGGLFNVLGIFLAGGLGGYVFLRDKEQEEKETVLKNELRSEKANLAKLEKEVQSTSEMILKEQSLVSELKQKSSEDQKTSSDKITLLEEQKDAISREVKATEKALEAERKLVEATKQEQRIVSKALDAEKEAKAAAEFEIEKLTVELSTTFELLKEESKLAKDIGLKTRELETELQSTKNNAAEAILEKSALREELDQKTIEAITLLNEKTTIEAQVADLEKNIENQRKESRSLEQKITDLESEQAELSKDYLKRIGVASDEREKAEEEVKSLKSVLSKEQENSRALQNQLESNIVSLEDQTKTVEALEAELSTVKEEAQNLNSQVATLQAEYDNQSSALDTEKKQRQAAEEEAGTLKTDLQDSWSQLESTVAELNKEQQEIKKLKAEMESVKTQYYRVSDKVEEEQARLMEAQKITTQLADQINKLTLEKDQVEKRADDLASQLEEARKISKKVHAKLEVEEKARMEEKNERDQLQQELDVLTKEAEKAQNAMEEVKKQLGEEMAARQSSDTLVKELKSKLEKVKGRKPARKRNNNVKAMRE